MFNLKRKIFDAVGTDQTTIGIIDCNDAFSNKNINIKGTSKVTLFYFASIWEKLKNVDTPNSVKIVASTKELLCFALNVAVIKAIKKKKINKVLLLSSSAMLNNTFSWLHNFQPDKPITFRSYMIISKFEGACMGIRDQPSDMKPVVPLFEMETKKSEMGEVPLLTESMNNTLYTFYLKSGDESKLTATRMSKKDQQGFSRMYYMKNGVVKQQVDEIDAEVISVWNEYCNEHGIDYAKINVIDDDQPSPRKLDLNTPDLSTLIVSESNVISRAKTTPITRRIAETEDFIKAVLSKFNKVTLRRAVELINNTDLTVIDDKDLAKLQIFNKTLSNLINMDLLKRMEKDKFGFAKRYYVNRNDYYYLFGDFIFAADDSLVRFKLI